MPYYDGFVLAVPTANKEKFIAHAQLGDGVFMDHGATRVLECWGEDVRKGHTTDFQGAVAAQDDETVVFSWIEWPDKATRDRVMKQMDALAKTDERMDPAKNPMPFDARRMIYGGFEPLLEQGSSSPDSYVQGFIVPVPESQREAYRRMAAEAWEMFKAHGALRVVEAWGDEVPEGKLTDFRRAVKATPDERVVFSFMEWPSRAACDAAEQTMMNEDHQPADGTPMPFDGKRLVFGGFVPVVRLSAARS